MDYNYTVSLDFNDTQFRFVPPPMARTYSITYLFLLFIIILPLTAGCSYLSRTTEPAPPSISAIYLVHGQGELDKRELQEHPEVVVTDSFDEVKQYATKKVAIWIDKNAAYDLTDADKQWLEEMPQTTYPIAVLGYDAGTSFNKVLGRCCRSGVPDAPPMVFSVIQGTQKTGTTPFESAKFLEEYPYRPNVQDVLDITNTILDR